MLICKDGQCPASDPESSSTIQVPYVESNFLPHVNCTTRCRIHLFHRIWWLARILTSIYYSKWDICSIKNGFCSGECITHKIAWHSCCRRPHLDIDRLTYSVGITGRGCLIDYNTRSITVTRS